MRLSLAVLLVFAVNIASEEIKTTLRVDERVRLLKENLKKELRKKHSIKILPIDDPIEFGSYEHPDDAPVTPILESDERKRDDQFKLRKLKTKPSPPSTSVWLKTVDTSKKNTRIGRNKWGSLKVRNQVPKDVVTQQTVSKPLDIFYRKSYTYNIDMNEPIPWLHCAEMVSPYLARAKKELTQPTWKTKDDHVVSRLFQLLSMNTTDFTKEEIYSVMYQISKMKIRFFSWDTEAMKLLFNILTKGYQGTKDQVHSFGALKYGVKKLFASWHLDRSNTTRLLMQSRVFRPPCIQRDHRGSSKFVPGSTLTPPKPGREGRITVEDNSSADCQNRAHDHGDFGDNDDIKLSDAP